MLQALTDYANTYLEEELADMAFEEKPVRYFLELDTKGRFCRIVDRLDKASKAKRAPLLKVPRSPVARNTGVHALLAVDSLQYVVGPAGMPGAWTEEGKEDNHHARFEHFQQVLREAEAAVGGGELKACVRFYERPDEVERARAAFIEEKAKTSDLVALALFSEDDDIMTGPIITSPAVRGHWSEHYNAIKLDKLSDAHHGQCLITKELNQPIATTHDKIKGTGKVGGRAEVALMSFDKAAFQSYGWTKNLNSPVSVAAASAYVLALNDLLRPGLHRRAATSDRIVSTRYDLGGTAFLYWTREPDDGDILDYLHHPEPEQIARLMRSAATGEPVTSVEANEFYLLGVAGNGARLVVCDWFTDSLEKVLENVRGWFEGLRVADPRSGGSYADPPRLSQLLYAMMPPASKQHDKANRSRAMALLRRAVQRKPLPREVLAAALGRIRVAKDTDRLHCPRAGLIRLCVNDLSTIQGVEQMGASLDENLKNPAYVCGRLLAVFENQQRTAHDYNINVTVADRYYGLASTSPQLAFPSIAKLAQAHQQKLRRGGSSKQAAARALEGSIAKLMEFLDGGFPAQLSLEDQGRFVVGFHHQKAEDARRLEERRAQKKAKNAEDQQ